MKSMFLDQCSMLDCYKYMDISGSGLEVNVCSLSEILGVRQANFGVQSYIPYAYFLSPGFPS